MDPSDSPPQPHRVAVIGGGISGLAAAHRLLQLQPDANLTLLEAGARLGGALHTHRDGDLLIEQGADSFLTAPAAARQLCEQLGIADELIPVSRENRRALVVCRGQLQPVPPGFVLMAPHRLKEIWKSPILSLRGKLRIMREPWVRPPPGIQQEDYDESVASFARRRLGWEVCERLVQPLMAGIYVADAERLSLAATQPRFLQAERDYGSLWGYVRAARAKGNREGGSSGARYDAFVTPSLGVGQLVDALAASLPPNAIQMNAPVQQVSRRANHWLISRPNSAPEIYDGLLLAVAAPVAGALLQQIDEGLADKLCQIRHASSVVVSLVYRCDQIRAPLDAFGLVAPAMERRKIIAASFASQKFPGRAPANMTILRVFLGGTLQPDLVELPDEQLIALASAELDDLMGVVGDPEMYQVKRWRDAMPQYDVGHLALVKQIEEAAGQHPGLALAGNAYRGVGIPHCIAYAQQAAERIHQSLSAAPGS